MTPKALDHLGSEKGDIGRPLRTRSWLAPGWIQLEGDELVWQWTRPDGDHRLDMHSIESRPREELLRRFTGLANGGEAYDDVLQFARRWDLLELCEHGIPNHHGHRCPAPSGHGREYAGAWRVWAKRLDAMVRAGADLHAQRIKDVDAWHILSSHLNEEGRVPNELESARGIVWLMMEEWLHLALISVSFSWPMDGEPKLSLAPGGLFGGLMLDLVTAISLTEGIGICSGCGAYYTPTRKPRQGQRSYCPTCREAGRPDRDRQRRRRQPKAPS